MSKDIKEAPAFLFVLFLVTVFLSEAVVILLLRHFGRALPDPVAIAVGSALFAGAVGLVLYMFVFRLLVREAEQRAQAQQLLLEKDQGLKAALHRADALHQQLNTANQRLDAVNQELETSRQKANAADQKLNAVGRQLAAYEQEIAGLNQKLSASEQKLKAAKTGLEEKAKEHAKELNDARASFEAEAEKMAQKLQVKKKEDEKVNAQMGEREYRVIELKKEVNKLSKELGQPEPYFGGV